MFRLCQGLSLLVLCGTLPLWADVCRGLSTGPADRADFLTSPRTVAYRISVKPDGPEFRITIRPLLLKWQPGAGPPVHAGDIEVAACEDGKQLQVLSITAWQPIDFAATFKAQDINFDAYLDFSVLTEFAAKWGSKSYWTYDPVSRRFVENELTRQLGENCLGSEWHDGCWKASFIDFDSTNHLLSAHYFIGVGQCGSPADRYRVENNRLIPVHREVLDMKPTGCTVTISDLINGTMRVTKVRRFDGKGQPGK